MKKLLLVTAIFVIPLLVKANGDPVMRYSAICRVANPEPLTISDISILKEVVNVKHEGLYNCFDITYTLFNNSKKDYPAIDYGFPIDYEESEFGGWGFDDSYIFESVYERGWNSHYIKDVGFSLDGKELQFQDALESIRASEYEIYKDTLPDGSVDSSFMDFTPEVKRRWYYTQFGVNRGDTVSLNVKYKVYASNECALFDQVINRYFLGEKDLVEVCGGSPVPFARRFFMNAFAIHYDFKRARHFGDGIIRNLNVNIDLLNLNKPTVWKGEDSEWLYQASQLRYEEWYLPADSLQPINLFVSHFPNSTYEEKQAVIDELSISQADYSIKEKGMNELMIVLSKPRFVSEVALDLDTAKVKQIRMEMLFENGRKLIQLYGLEADKDLSDFMESVPFCKPMLLPIVDSYKDRYRQKDKVITSIKDFDSDFFRLSAIKLKFLNISKSEKKPPYDNIRLLDSRWLP